MRTSFSVPCFVTVLALAGMASVAYATAVVPGQVVAPTTSAATKATADEFGKVRDLLRRHNCMACHTVERRLVGPSFRDADKLYTGGVTDTNVETLARKLIRGSSGRFGPIPMPANPNLKQEDAELLATWVLRGAPQ